MQATTEQERGNVVPVRGCRTGQSAFSVPVFNFSCLDKSKVEGGMNY